MADRTSNRLAVDGRPANRDEIDALGEVIAATLAMAVRAHSVAVSALLERALATLDDRVRAMSVRDDGDQDAFRAS